MNTNLDVIQNFVFERKKLKTQVFVIRLISQHYKPRIMDHVFDILTFDYIVFLSLYLITDFMILYNNRFEFRMKDVIEDIFLNSFFLVLGPFFHGKGNITIWQCILIFFERYIGIIVVAGTLLLHLFVHLIKNIHR